MILLIVYIAFQLAPATKAYAQVIAPVSLATYKKKMDKAECNSQEFKEALQFVSIATLCTRGNNIACEIAWRRSKEGKFFASATSVGVKTVVAMGVSSAIKISDLLLKDPKKIASDNSYLNEIIQSIGGKEVDRYVKENGGTPQAALEKAEKDLARAAEGGSKPEVTSNLENLTKKLQKRVAYAKENESVLSNGLSKIKFFNDSVQNEMTKIAVNLDKEKKAPHPNQKAIAKMEEDLLSWAKKVRTIKTQSQMVATAANQSIEQLATSVRELSAKCKDCGPLLDKVAKTIKGKQIGKIPTHPNSVERLIYRVTSEGYEIVNQTGAFESLPEWAKDLRISQKLDTPRAVVELAKESPHLKNDEEAFFKELARREHERYLEKTKSLYMDSYANERRIMAEIGVDWPNLEVTGRQYSLNERKKWVLNLTKEQDAEIQKAKPNWFKVSKPLSELDADNLAKTLNPMIRFGEEHFPGYSYGKGFSSATKYFMENPKVGKAIGVASRLGTNWILAGAFLWWDARDWIELGMTGGMALPQTRDIVSDYVVPQCRLPAEKKIGGANQKEGVGGWMCGCKTTLTGVEKLGKICQSLPSQMDAETSEVCELAVSDGRDRDLRLAQMYNEIQNKKPELAKLIQEAAGCDVMKNYPSNCNYTTTEISEQGMYFLDLIRENRLEPSVTKICPDVCRHWIGVANKKMEELNNSIEKALALPEDQKDNIAVGDCEKKVESKDPPTERSTYLNWKSCQRQIQCLSENEAIVSLKGRDLEYYIASFRPQDKSLKSMQLIRSNIQTKDLNTKKDVPAYVYTAPLFEMNFDEFENISNITSFDYFKTGGGTKKIDADEFEQEFGAMISNPHSSRVTTTSEESALSRRAEMKIIADKAKNYCCKGSFNCRNTQPTQPHADEATGKK